MNVWVVCQGGGLRGIHDSQMGAEREIAEICREHPDLQRSDFIVQCDRVRTLQVDPVAGGFVFPSLSVGEQEIGVGDVYDLGIRRVRVCGLSDGVTVARDSRRRVAVRNVETNRLSYMPSWRLNGNPKVARSGGR